MRFEEISDRRGSRRAGFEMCEFPGCPELARYDLNEIELCAEHAIKVLVRRCRALEDVAIRLHGLAIHQSLLTPEERGG